MVEQLAALHCTTAEMAAVLGCSRDTLERNFAAVLEKGREGGRERLRRLQWKAAERGNVVMLIWLGKQLLGQKDRQEHQVTGADGEPLLGLDTLRRVLAAAEGNGASVLH